VGPTLSDVLAVSGGKRFTLASAYYSAARLDATTMDVGAVEILVRLDLDSIDDWVTAAIAPDALLRLWLRHTASDIRVYYSPTAHAKIYAGDQAYLIGSANYTVRGLSGTTSEVLWLESEPSRRREMERAIAKYRSSLKLLTRAELEEYVTLNIAEVKKRRSKARRSSEDTLPPDPDRPARMGTYEHYLAWLSTSRIEQGPEIRARAAGKGQLSGHIRMNFLGIRQFLIAHPQESGKLRSKDPATYSLAADAVMEGALKKFVETEAADEGALSVDIWRTYLPMRSGGKPKSGGGTSGNLNRMLPQIARYLAR
jgi:hypothetical protein